MPTKAVAVAVAAATAPPTPVPSSTASSAPVTPGGGIRIMRRETPIQNDASSEASSATNDSQTPGTTSAESSTTGGSGRMTTTFEERTAAYEEARKRIFKDFNELSVSGSDDEGDASEHAASEQAHNVGATGSGSRAGVDAGGDVRRAEDDEDDDFPRRSQYFPTGPNGYYQALPTPYANQGTTYGGNSPGYGYDIASPGGMQYGQSAHGGRPYPYNSAYMPAQGASMYPVIYDQMPGQQQQQQQQQQRSWQQYYVAPSPPLQPQQQVQLQQTTPLSLQQQYSMPFGVASMPTAHYPHGQDPHGGVEQEGLQRRGFVGRYSHATPTGPAAKQYGRQPYMPTGAPVYAGPGAAYQQQQTVYPQMRQQPPQGYFPQPQGPLSQAIDQPSGGQGGKPLGFQYAPLQPYAAQGAYGWKGGYGGAGHVMGAVPAWQQQQQQQAGLQTASFGGVAKPNGGAYYGNGKNASYNAQAGGKAYYGQRPQYQTWGSGASQTVAAATPASTTSTISSPTTPTAGSATSVDDGKFGADATDRADLGASPAPSPVGGDQQTDECTVDRDQGPGTAPARVGNAPTEAGTATGNTKANTKAAEPTEAR
ncbi:uncharacterized protein V1518DRAFT_235893 [Limtongia smithiae]|uniref:uncharacterized protein n=1 Tax=Limtongia smithiae TaxID=1125753 RepID=UPI0034D00BAD